MAAGRERCGWVRGGVRLSCVALALVLAGTQAARGQPVASSIVLDDTLLGTAPDVPTAPLAGGGVDYLITDAYGRYDPSATNLFHSFSEFDLGSGDRATFSAEQGFPERLIARVTGGTSSEIYGTLRSTVQNTAGEGADLIFINPSGIELGSGARLEVAGSLYLSTADVLRFADGADFDTDPARAPVLSAALPSAFGFIDDAFAPVAIRGASGLRVAPGETLSLVGGDADGAGSNAAGVAIFGTAGAKTINAPGATLEIASAAGPAEIPIDAPLAAFDPTDPDAVAPGALGDVLIHSEAWIDVSSGFTTASFVPAGSIVIRAERFQLNASMLRAYNSVGTAASPAIDVVAAGSAEIGGGSQIDVAVGADAEAAGDVSIAAERIAIRGAGTLVRTRSLNAAPGPTIALRGDEIEISDRAIVGVTRDDPGAAGPISIDARALELRNAVISAATTGSAAAGDIAIVASERVRVEVGSAGAPIAVISTQTTSEAADAGPGGDISVATDRLELRDGGQISASSIGAGDAGSIEIRAGSVEIGGTAGDVESGVFAQATDGNLAGEIAIAAEREIRLADGARVTAQSSGRSDAGAIKIVAGSHLEVTDSAVTTRAERSSGGQIDVRAQELTYLRNGEISTDVASGEGTGGDVRVDSRLVVLNEGRIVADADDNAGGNITIAGTLFVSSPFFASPPFSDSIPFAIPLDAGAQVPDRASVISATSRAGSALNGAINANTPETDLVTELAVLPASYLDASALLASACDARMSPAGSFQVQPRAVAQTPPDAAFAPPGWPDSLPAVGTAGAQSPACEPQEGLQ